MEILLRGYWLQLNSRRLCQFASASAALSQFSGGWSNAVRQNNDRVELVTFDVGAAARQQKRSLAELHYVQHVGKSCAPIVVIDDGFDDNRRSRTILVNASAAAHARRNPVYGRSRNTQWPSSGSSTP